MSEPTAICTLVIIALTVLCSFKGFRDPRFTERFIFSPTAILADKQYYRLFTSAFLHADLNHLLTNMVTLFLFGSVMEQFVGPLQFLVIYFAAIVGGGLLSLWVHRHHEYSAYGASGGVCGMVFSYIALFPTGTIFAQMFIPLPAWAYGILFLVGSFVRFRRKLDNIGHDAHIGGAIIGLWTTGALQPWAVWQNLNWFLILSGVSVALFIYFLKNPLFLPLRCFTPKLGRREKSTREVPAYRREARDIDAVLEKISRGGMESLTAEEKSFLKNVSNKYQNRAQSEKPKSDLII